MQRERPIVCETYGRKPVATVDLKLIFGAQEGHYHALFRHEPDVTRTAMQSGAIRTRCLGCHRFRATGIAAYFSNGGSLENAQATAAHESPRTTKLYDRTGARSRLM